MSNETLNILAVLAFEGAGLFYLVRFALATLKDEREEI